jgi:hypothetical protein
LKTKIFSIAIALASLSAAAQPRTGSPLTATGYGQIENRNYSMPSAMGGTNAALRDPSQLNMANPASLTALDSMTFIFEVGMSAKFNTISEQGSSRQINNSNFDYAGFAFPIAKFWRTGVGISPFSSAGYDFYNQQTIPETGDTVRSSFSGISTISDFYWNNGFSIVKGLSIGVSAHLMLGNAVYAQENIVFQGQPRGSAVPPRANGFLTGDTVRISGFVFDFAAQQELRFSNGQIATLGLSFRPGQKLGMKTSGGSYINNKKIDSVSASGLQTDMPLQIAAGVSIRKRDLYNISADFEFTNWQGASVYGQEWSNMKNSMRISAGAELLPDKFSLSYFKKVKYRIGGQLYRPYWAAPDGSQYMQLGGTAGFGLPFRQSRNTINLSAEFGRLFAPGTDALSEQYLLVKANITLFDKWFHKRKID